MKRDCTDASCSLPFIPSLHPSPLTSPHLDGWRCVFGILSPNSSTLRCSVQRALLIKRGEGWGWGVGVCVLHPQVVFVCVLRVMRALDEMNA